MIQEIVENTCIYLHACVLRHSVLSELCDPLDCTLPGFSVHGTFWIRILEWEEEDSLEKEIFPTQELNPYLLRWQVDSLPLSHLGSLVFEKNKYISLTNVTLFLKPRF